MSAAGAVVVDVVASGLHGQDVLAAGPTWAGVDDSRGIGVRDEWTPSQAEERTAAIVASLRDLRAALSDVTDLVDQVHALIHQAWTMHAHLVLGYPTFESYCSDRFGDLGAIRLPRADRMQLVAALVGTVEEPRCSVRGAARLLSIADQTARADLARLELAAAPLLALPAAPQDTEPTTSGPVPVDVAIAVDAVLADGSEPARSVALLLLDALAAAGLDGLTIPEAIAVVGRSYGTTSSGLHRLEVAGHAERIDVRRGTFSPYVLAGYLAGDLDGQVA